MIGAAGVGKTANFLYPNIEYACASGMSFVTTDTKGDPFRNYAGIAREHYGYRISILDLRNPTRSDGGNILTMVNKYMDEYLADTKNLAAKARAEKYAKITAKTIICSDGAQASSYGQNAFFYDAAEGLLASVILLFAEYCPPQKRHIVSVFKLLQDLMAPSPVKNRNLFQLLMDKLPPEHKAKWFAGAALNSAEQTRLPLFLKWGIVFGEAYEVPERAAREVYYADRFELEQEIVRRRDDDEMEDEEPVEPPLPHGTARTGGQSHAPALQEKEHPRLPRRMPLRTD